MTIAPETRMGAVRLTVSDLDRQRDFYESAIGLRSLTDANGVARLAAPEGGEALVEIVEDTAAPPRPPRTTGLFHLAILVPDRAELARALHRVAGAGRFTGASDHLVSEALYLSDPEGNGIEIYRDRPRDEWRHADGELQMDTIPLDLQSVLSEVPGEAAAPPAMASGTRIGHVHLNVADIPASEAFYGDVLGFEPTVRSYPGALFVSAGGYHHHLGLNTWSGQGAPPPPAGALGLRRFEIVVPGPDELERIARAVEAAGIDSAPEDEGLSLSDPAGNGILVRAGTGEG